MLMRRPLLRRLQRGEGLVAAGDPVQAEAEFRAVMAEIAAAADFASAQDIYVRTAERLGALLMDSRRFDDVRAMCRDMLRLIPACPTAHFGLAQLDMPGDNYLRVLEELHQARRPAVYVEIGIRTGTSLALAGPPTLALGVDPRPQIEVEFKTETRVYPETSDAFFAAWSERPELREKRIDMAFLDGLHWFEQTLRDFINAERLAAPGALILLHDCVPVDALTAAREEQPTLWAGDVWKLLPIFWRYRPDLDLQLIGAFPTGLLAVRNLDPGSRVLAERFDGIVAEHMPLGFERFESEVRPRLRYVPSEAVAVARLLSAKPAPAAVAAAT